MTITASIGTFGGLADVNYLNLRFTMGNQVTTVADPVWAMEAGTNQAAVQTTSAFDYMIDGNPQTQISTVSEEVVSITSSDDDSTTQAVSTTCYYVIAMNAAGDFLGYKGRDGETTAAPRVPGTACPVAILKIVNASTTVEFTLGTTDFDAASVTATFTGIKILPATLP